MIIVKLQEELKQAQLSHDEIKVSTLRMLLSEIHNTQIQKGGELSDQDLVSILQREAKKRKEAAEGFRQGGREESAQKEETELKIIQAYLPQQLSDEELTKIVEEAINNMGAASIQDMGKVMSSVMGKVAGRAEGTRVSTLVKERLSS